jgi:hypothetical protein
MVSYWSRFARSANPNSFSTPLWQEDTVSTDRIQTLAPPNPQAYTGTAFAIDHKCAFWAALSGH